MLQIDYGFDLQSFDVSMIDILHQNFDTREWTTTSLHESEVLNFQNELDSLGLDYLPVV
jgi:hypothetical protein